MLPLCFAKLNTDYEIISLQECKNNQKSFMERGFMVGAKITLQEKKGNTFIVKLNDNTKYVVGFGMARKIFLKEN